jgi:hypothetical protein
MKYQDLVEISDPAIVYRKFINLYPPESHIKISNRAGKKYAIFNPHTQKYFHFGSLKSLDFKVASKLCFEGSTMPDFTRHKDIERRNKFLKRNNKWKYSDMYTSAHAFYFLLW